MAKTSGWDIKLLIVKDGATVEVKGQKGATLNRQTEDMETTTKDSEGVKEFEPSYSEWDVEAEGIWSEDDLGYEALEDMYDAKQKFVVELKNAQTGRKYRGLGFLNDLPLEFPSDDKVQYSMKIRGSGKLERVAGTQTP